MSKKEQPKYLIAYQKGLEDEVGVDPGEVERGRKEGL